MSDFCGKCGNAVYRCACEAECPDCRCSVSLCGCPNTRSQANAEVASRVMRAQMEEGQMRDQAETSYDALLLFLSQGSDAAIQMGNDVFVYSPVRGTWSLGTMPPTTISLRIHSQGGVTFNDGIIDHTKPKFGSGIDASLKDVLALAMTAAVRENRPYYVTGVYEEHTGISFQTAWTCGPDHPQGDVWIHVYPTREACIESDLPAYSSW